MDGKPVVIRLLDAPLHEFLPEDDLKKEIESLEADNGNVADLTKKKELLKRADDLREQNPMMGHRGCRLGLTYPGIYEMQVRAIVRAALDLVKEGLDPRPEVMIPLVMDTSELQTLNPRLQAIAAEYEEAAPGRSIPFGTMVELPRAALTADRISPEVRFFSFGSNDLTQMTFGFSRDDAQDKFLSEYVQRGILSTDPFANLDENGVGQLIAIAVEKGRSANADLELGLCGEHGGDPQSIDFCHRTGLTYVSCSPMRIPIARLAAAQAALGSSDRDV
jgi:pyruvate,orthophosphate dikinase